MGPCVLKGKTKIGKGCIAEPGAWIDNSRIGDGCHLKASSYLVDARLEKNVSVGPFAHLRPGSVVKENGKIGNFVELKKSTIGAGSKVNHLSYIGDAKVGNKVNIGAGTITCNYDGKDKFKTVLEDGVFVGSDTQFVAPVRVGKNAYIGAGSTITKNVKAGSLALTRAEQKEVPNWKNKK
jgi:bifunctional UDP-N-acetylglucosamine pyrophosphorylase/glucosamine-1-phosphate N-acetyltransferase